jgi:hypothetical protein
MELESIKSDKASPVRLWQNARVIIKIMLSPQVICAPSYIGSSWISSCTAAGMLSVSSSRLFPLKWWESSDSKKWQAEPQYWEESYSLPSASTSVSESSEIYVILSCGQFVWVFVVDELVINFFFFALVTTTYVNKIMDLRGSGLV